MSCMIETILPRSCVPAKDLEGTSNFLFRGTQSLKPASIWQYLKIYKYSLVATTTS